MVSQASQITQTATGRADARVQQARGDTDRFSQLLARQRIFPEQTSADLYLNAAKRILPRAKLVLLAPEQAPRIDRNVVQQQSNP